MNVDPTLSQESAWLLDQAANRMESTEDRCLAAISSAQHESDRIENISDDVEQHIDTCRLTIQGILSEPDLRLWMDDSDRTDLFDLARKFSQFENEKTQLLSGEPHTHNAYRNLFSNMRSRTRMASTLIKSTHKSLRHHSRTHLIDYPAIQDRPSPVHLRWMIQRDLPEVLAIDKESFEFPWSEEEYVRNLRATLCIGMVAEELQSDRIVGSMVYELHRHMINILRFAVSSTERTKGIGAGMMKKLRSCLGPIQQRRVLLALPESNISGLTYAARQQFNTVALIPGMYTETDDDACLLEYLHQRKKQAVSPHNHTTSLAG